MTYTLGELDSMTREAERHNAAAVLRCPLAAALRQEIDDLQPFIFDERFYLLGSASNACSEAVLAGRDFRLDGLEDALDVAQVIKFSKE